MNIKIYRHFLSTIVGVALTLALAGDSSVEANLNTCDDDTFTPNYAGDAAPLHWWRQFPVKVYFSGKGTFANEDGSRVDLESVILEGFDQWVDATESKISYVITDERDDADIIIKWGQHSGSVKDGENFAVTDLIYNPKTGKMLKATIVFYLWEEMSPPEVFNGLKKTAAHEFAHALGMRGHSGDRKDLMFRRYTPNKFTPLTERDINTMKTQYCSLFR